MRYNLLFLFMSDLSDTKSGVVCIRNRLIIFFTNLYGNGVIDFQQLVGMVDISSRISKHKIGNLSLTKDEGNLSAGIVLLSYHSCAACELLPTTMRAI